jgi:hypothetical protein
MTVDGVDFILQEPWPWDRHYNPRFFSHKSQGAGYRYEMGVCIQTGDIVWVNGPFKCGDWPDINIFRRDLKGRLAPGEKVEADAGYRGDDSIRTPNDVANMVDRRAKSVARARHETINHRFKKFYALGGVFRHHRRMHKPVFSAVAVITQLSIDHGERPFHVNY